MLKRLRMWTDPTLLPLRRTRVIAMLAISLLALGACGPQPPAMPPPGPSPFVEADALFSAGDYAAAANAYRRALSASDPSIDVDREQALFKLALVYALPQSPVGDLDQAQSFLNQMITEYPDTARDVEIQTLLDLGRRVTELSSTIEALGSTVDRLETERSEQTETIGLLRDQLAQLALQLEETQTELDKLREIDLGRRPRE